ncbi:MAG: DNA/RNA nuclease SfsA [Oscillospiraceae bacterium]
MKYQNIKQGIFISRPNRFIALVEIEGAIETVHVKNTGRCKELLTPQAVVFVEGCDNPLRKTRFDLIAVYKGNRLINMDSQVPNKVVGEWLLQTDIFGKIDLIRPETVYKSSRFDFYIEAQGKRIFAEVKGVTLEENGVLKFPDAPTLRGIKHINELCDCADNGYCAYIIFVIQMEGADYFTPNYATQPEFGAALKAAQQHGVNILAFDCLVTQDSITAHKPVKIVL